jgi:zinc protease
MRGKLTWRGLAALVLIAVAAGSLPAAPRQVASVEGITEYALDNGLRVLLFPDPARPTVTVNLTVLVGSRHEGYGEGGMAHLLEHMLFKGTPTHPKPDRLFTERGAKYNGSTSEDRTNYFETLPAGDENLQFAVRFEADRLVNCPIKAEELATEMTVVRNEFEMSENDPFGVLFKRIVGVAYEWHNYGKPTIGNRSDVERVPAGSLKRFYQKHYQPDNAVLVIAGRFDQPKALEYVEKHFGAIPRPARKLEATYTEEPPQDGERTVTLRRVGDVGIVALLYHVPAGAHEEFPAVRALQEILGDTPTGLLHKTLVEPKKASFVGGYASAMHDPGYLIFLAGVRQDQSRDEVRRVMLETVDRLVENGVTEEDVTRVKTRFVAERRRELANSERLAVALSQWAAQGDWRLFFVFRDRMEKLAPKDVGEAAKKYLRASNRTVGVYVPTKQADRTPVPAAPDVAAIVKGYKGRAAAVAGEQLDPDPLKLEARVTRKELPGGIRLALLSKKSREEMVVVRLALHYGNEQNLKGLTTAAEMLPDLMARGTRQLSRQQLQDALEKHQATLSPGGTAGSVQWTLQAPKQHLAGALELLRQVLREPALAETEFEILKQEALASLEYVRRDPGALAGRAVERKLNPYPKDDVRYQPTLEEDIERLHNLKLAQVRDLYAKHMGAQAAQVAVVGEFDPAQVEPLLGSILSGWKASMPYARIARRAADGVSGTAESIETPDKDNAVYEAGLAVAMTDSHPDYPALSVACHVLGGSPAARLFQRVREKEGLSYGVGASFSARPLDPEARLRLRAICNPGNVPKAKTAILEEVQRLVAAGVSAEELTRERNSFLKQRGMSRSQDGVLASMLVSQLYAGRTMKYEADLEEKIRSLKPEQVSAAFRKYIDPKRLTVVTAGDFAGAKSKAAAGNGKKP